MLKNASAAAAQAASIQPILVIVAVAVALLLVMLTRRKARATATTANRAGQQSADHAAQPLSGVLLASRPERDVGSTARTTLWSMVVHACLIAALVWATMSLGIKAEEDEQVTIVELPPEETPPPPPPPPPTEVQPEVAPTEIAKGFQTLSVPTIVPPDIPPPQLGVRIREADFSGVGAEGGRADGKEGAPPQSDLTVAPTFTPYTVAPELKNTEEVRRVLERNYPPLLRDAGIGGTVLLWFLIDETGKVIKTQVKEGSGHPPLDEAATKVAEVMKFSPAKNRDQLVTVWVAIPIQFNTR